MVLERRPFRQQSLGTRFRPPGSLLCVAAREASPSIASACGFRFRTADTSGIIVCTFALRSYHRGISPVILLCAMPAGILIVVLIPAPLAWDHLSLLSIRSVLLHQQRTWLGYQCKSTVSGPSRAILPGSQD